MSAADQFRKALAAAGLAPRGDLNLADDGKLQRYRIEGDKSGSRNGWAVLHSHPVTAGAFGSWKNGESHTWCERTSKPPTASERAERQRLMKAAQVARSEELATVQASARKQAAKLWALAYPATNAHPYLKRKQIGAYGIRQLRESLVIAARDTHGELHTLQFIGAEALSAF